MLIASESLPLNSSLSLFIKRMENKVFFNNLTKSKVNTKNGNFVEYIKY